MRKLGVAAVVLACLSVPPVAGANGLSVRDRRAIDAVLDRFVPSALPRRNLAQSYDLVTPRLREGTPRAKCVRGDIPIHPSPAATMQYHSWQPLLVARNAVELNLFVQPRKKAKVGPIAFAIDLKRIGGRWLVDDVSIEAIFPAVGSAKKVWSGKDTAPAPTQGREVGGDRSRISLAWIALPAGLVGLFVLFPIGLFLHRWR